MDARLVSLETEKENAFVIENLLWIGFFGEAYTGYYCCLSLDVRRQNIRLKIFKWRLITVTASA